MIVLDASVAVDLLLGTRRGQRIRFRLEEGEETLHAPHLLDLEVAQAIRRYTRAGQIDEDAAKRSLELLTQLDIARYPHDVLLSRIWSLRHNLTAYDGAYVALAEALDATLLTFDEKIARAPNIVARVEVP